MDIMIILLIILAFGLVLPWVEIGFYFYMVHGEVKVIMLVGVLLVALAITGIILV